MTSPELIAQYSRFDAVEMLREINKAFAAGHDFDVADMTGSQAGRIESLERTFKDLSYQVKDATFWSLIKKNKVTSTVLEHSTFDRESGGNIWIQEGGDPSRQDDFRTRHVELVKFAAVRCAITFPAILTNMITPGEIQESDAKMRKLIRGLNETCYFGDEDLNGRSFNGMRKQVLAKSRYPSQQRIDLRGKRLRDETLNDAATTILDEHGIGQFKLFLSNQASKSYVQHKAQTQAYITNVGGNVGRTQIGPADQKFREFDVDAGVGMVHRDIFLRARNPIWDRIVSPIDETTLIKHDDDAPAAPTVTVVSEATTTNYALPDGTWDFLVVPVHSDYGFGLGEEASQAFTGGNRRAKLTITKAGSGSVPTSYRIYRRHSSKTDMRDYYFVKEVKATTGNAVALDDNETIPGTTTAFMVDWDMDQVIDMAQLSDVMKLPYGIRADKKEWIIKFYGALRVFNGNRIIMIENIGDEPWS